MTFVEFLSKYKTILIIGGIIILAIILGLVFGRMFGGIAGLAGLAWNAITGKKSKELEQHEAAQKALDEEIEKVKAKQEEVIKTMASSKEDETRIRDEIAAAKAKYKDMDLSVMIQEHNAKRGIQK